MEGWGGARLLERDAEVEELRTALRAAQAGRGKLVAIEADAGFGKSRLLASAREHGERAGLEVLVAAGSHLERDLPFGVVQQLLSGEPAAATAATPSDEQGLAAIVRFRDLLLRRALACGEERRPHLLLVDDAHWADPPSLRFLVHLVLRLHELPISIAIAARPRELEQWPPELDQLGSHATLLSPPPLSADAVGLVVAESIGEEADPALSAAVLEATGGNPFYLFELVRELGQVGSDVSVETVRNAAPKTVLRAVLARLGRIGTNAGELAVALAVLEVDSPLDLVAEQAGLELEAAEPAADDLARAGLVSPGEPLRFTHPLIGSTLRSDLGAFALARAHRRAAELLRARNAPASRIAPHLVHSKPAGDPWVVETLRAAATADREKGSPASAVKLLRRAFEESPESPSRGELLVELAEAEALSGVPEALDHLEEARTTFIDPHRRAEASEALARILHHAGEFAAAAEVADRAREEVGEGELSDRLQARWISTALLYPPLHDRLDTELEPLINAARRGDPPDDPCVNAMLAARLASLDEPADIVRPLALAAFAADPLVDGDSLGSAVGFAAWGLMLIDALDEAHTALDRAIEEATERGATIALAVARNLRAYVLYHRGDLAAAVDDAKRSLEIFEYGWSPSPWSAPILIRSQLALGDLEGARATLAMAETGAVDRADRALMLEARARVHLADGQPAAALEDTRAVKEIVEHGLAERSVRAFDWLSLAARAAHGAGREAEARELAAEAVRRAREGAVARQLGRALTIAGTVTGGDEGLELLTEAVEVLDASPSALTRAHALLELGAALRRAGKRDQAKRNLYAALDLGGSFGAEPLIQRARDELASVGLRPRRTARSGPGALTPSELRVATLAANGLSTRQIAQQIYVTPKTVEGHLTNVYRKLEITGRKELTTALETE